ncbi:MAG: metallophosphoesterase [Lachnospiraceae bacterium]|nr:metallophosphoesterase [Lachnospiraceae bacterium]
MKFIHIADVHLGIKPDRGRIWSDERADEIYDSFKNVVKFCEQEKADLLLIAGDLFDAPPDEQNLKQLDFQLSRLSNTKTIIIGGANDYIEEGSAWEAHVFNSNTIIMPRDKAANVYLEDINVCVTGFSYGKPEYEDRILERLKPGREGAYNILLGHGGEKNYMPFSKEKLAKTGFDYIALGHVHKPAHILKNKMAFAGSLEPLNYTETGRRGFIMGDVDSEGNTNISWVPSNQRSYVNMTLEIQPDTTNAQLQEIVETEIKKRGRENIYRILLKGTIDSKMEINLSGLTRRYNINELIDRTEYDYTIDELYHGNETNLLGRFIDMFDEESTEDDEIREKALSYGIEALLGAGEN